jgi:hypothetical protein
VSGDTSLVPPTFSALPDGSLITDLYFQFQSAANFRLFANAVFLVLFIRNVIEAISYVRRIRAKNMILFYMLVFSQFWGPVCFLALLAPYVISDVNCSVYV